MNRRRHAAEARHPLQPAVGAARHLRPPAPAFARQLVLLLLALASAVTAVPDASAAPAAECACDCPEFFSSKRDGCRSQCGNYGSMSGSCVIQRERARGRSDAQIEAAIKDCPTDCAALRTETRAICLDATYALVVACKAAGPNGASKRQVDCYLDYLVRELEEPMKSQFRQQNAEQLAAMDAQGRDQFVGAMLDALSGEGYRCPR